MAEEKKCCCCCFWPWLSGFFAMPAIAHIIRLISGWEITMRGEPFTMKASWMVVIVCGLLSIICCALGCRKKKEDGAASGQSCCS